MSATEIIRELLHHTQQEMYKEGAEEGKKCTHTKEMVSKERTKREEDLMSGPPCRL